MIATTRKSSSATESRSALFPRAPQFGVFGLCLLVANSTFALGTRVFDETIVNQVSQVAYWDFAVQPGQPYFFETDQLVPQSSCAPDTVIHVVHKESGTWVGTSDMCGASDAACITVTAPTGHSPITLRVIVHAYETCALSTGTFRATGPGVDYTATNRRFGGHVLWTTDGYPFSWTTEDRLQAVRIANGAPANLVVVAGTLLGTPEGMVLTMSGYGIGGWYNGGTEITPWASTANFAGYIVVGTTGVPLPQNTTARFYINDVDVGGSHTSDADSDDLGDLLEQELGTCWENTVAGCSPANGNARDTDRDGLADGLELLGDGRNFLAAWGANPLHKDVFVEVDRLNGALRFTGTQSNIVQGLFDDGAAADLKNPDGEDGVAVHLDVGLSSCQPLCSTIWGDWGGHTYVTDVPAAVKTGDEYIWASTEKMDAWRDNVFRYGLGDSGCGGQANGFRFGFGNSAMCDPVEQARVFAHELGHTAGLEHGGEQGFNGKPNYPSLMNYAFPMSIGFSNGTLDPLNPTALCETTGAGGLADVITQEFSFPNDPNDPNNQRLDWNRDGDWSDCPVRTNPRWAEWFRAQASYPSEAYGRKLEPAGAKERAPLGLASDGDRLVVVYLGQNDFLRTKRFVSTLLMCPPGETEECCAGAGDAFGDVCGEWTEAQNLPDSPTSGPAAATFTTTVQDGLAATRVVYLACTNVAGTGRILINSVDFSGAVGTSQVLTTFPACPIFNGPVPEDLSIISVANKDGVLWGLYRTTDDTLRQIRILPSLQVVDDGVVTAGGTPVLSGWAPAMAVDPTSGILAAVVSDPPDNGIPEGERHRLHRINHVAGATWTLVADANAFDERLQSAGGPMSMAASVDTEPPYLMLRFVPKYTWVVNDGNWGDTEWYLTWGAYTDTAGRFNYRNKEGADWSRYHAGGMHLVQFHSRLSAVGVYFNEEDEEDDTNNRRLRFWPFADGIADIVLTDTNDWRLMHDNMCRVLASAGGASPLICVAPGAQAPPWPDQTILCPLPLEEEP